MIHNPIVMRKEKYVKLYSAILPAGRMRGDVDGDGALTSDDSDCLKRYNANWDGYEWVGSEPAADVNGDGEIKSNDAAMLDRIVNGVNGYTPGSAGPEITGNWTNNPNYATDTAQFYTDIPASQFTSSDKVRIKVDDGAFDKIERVECLDGMVRVYVTLCPINEIPCTIATSSEQQIFCWLRKSDNLYDLRIENRGVES